MDGSVYFSAIQMALISKQYVHVLSEIACHIKKSNYILTSVFRFWKNDTLDSFQRLESITLNLDE